MIGGISTLPIRVSTNVIFYLRQNQNFDEILVISSKDSIFRNFDVEIGISISIVYFRRNRNSDEISFWFRRIFDI
jgi:hypothetical protein